MRKKEVNNEALEHLVYVVGPARGGTSIMFDSLGISEHILVLPGMTHFMNHVYRYRNKVHQRLLNIIFRIPFFYDQKKILSGLEKSYRKQILARINSSLQKKDLKKMWQNYPLIYGLSDEYDGDIQKIKCWADKANDYFGLKQIREKFGNAKFILVFRGPHASVLSLTIRSAGLESNETLLPPESIINSCLYWRNFCQNLLRFEKNCERRVYKVKFEDFVLKPERMIASILNFIEVPDVNSDNIKEGLSSMHYGTSNNPEQKGKGIKKEPLKRWESRLSKWEQDIISEITYPVARRLGYHIDLPEQKLGLWGLIKLIRGFKQKVTVASKLLYLWITLRFI